MRFALCWVSVFALVSFLSACGGKSSSDGSSGSGGTSLGGSGGTSLGGSGGTSLGGSGGTSLGGSGGVGGDECTAELQKQATLDGPPVGFDALPGTPGPFVVAAVLPNEIQLSVSGDTSTFSFSWVGPDLTGKFTKGETVSIGNQEGWDFVSGSTHTAAARRDFGFVAPSQIPDIPLYGPHLDYAPQCSFLEGGGACGQPPAPVTILALEATTGAGALTIALGDTQSLVDWDITNVNNVQFPGYGGEDCVLEAAFTGIITAVGPALDTAQ